MEIAVHQVDSFATELFGGNPAGVVSDAHELTDEQMGNIAREMNLSETAFVLPPDSTEADVRLRFFTPTKDEIKFCGHATVGALFQLAQLDAFGLGELGVNDVRVQTNAGILPMQVMNESTNTLVKFEAPAAVLEPYRLQGDAFAEASGVDVGLIKPDTTILVDSVLNYIYIPAASLQKLNDQVFDFAKIRANFGAEGVVVFCFFTNETIAPDADILARGLAPNVGVDEDPFTGSMQAGMVLAAKQNNVVPQDQQRIVTEQGYSVGRPGRATIMHDAAVNSIKVGASAVGVFSTVMEIK